MLNKSVKGIVLSALVLLFLLALASQPAHATPPEMIIFELDVQLGGGAEGSWSASGLVNSSGYGEFNPRVTGWFDPATGQFRTVHDYMTLYDDQGSITIDSHGRAAAVTDEQGVDHEGFALNWTIISATGAYEDLHGQGNGYAWPDFSTFRFPVFMSGQAHFDPQ